MTDLKKFKIKLNPQQSLMEKYKIKLKSPSQSQYITTKSGCKEIGCNVKHPSFNYMGETKGLYCSTHQLDNMFDIKHPKCKSFECKTRPSFNYDTEISGLYCFTHRLDGMVSMDNRHCLSHECKKRPSFNYDEEIKGLYCYDHKLDYMIDVLHPRCKSVNCKTRPYFNYENQKFGMYCSTHKLDGMIDVINLRCQSIGCKTAPLWNYDGKTIRLYCSDHKLDGMIDIAHPHCKTPLCFTQISSKYDGYCVYCYIHMFPDKPISRNYKTKERSVVEYIQSNYGQFNWIDDKIISGGCSRRRPDLLLDLGYQVLIIEIDENQHTDYDCSCENKRIMELSQDVGHRPIVFIRFNPDDYINENNKNITSCWGLDKNGLCTIKKSKKNEWIERLKVLDTHVAYWTDENNKTNKTIEIIQLFYDLN